MAGPVVARASQHLQTWLQSGDRRTVLTLAGTATALLGTALLYRRWKSRTAGPKFPPSTLPEEAVDAVIVGAGPAGSVCAYYLSKSGAKVALLEKEAFPRDKYCANCVVTPAIRILEDMGVLQQLQAKNQVHFSDSGGLVSPSGISYIGATKQKLGQAVCCAIKRIHLDAALAGAAQQAGVQLQEQFEVCGALFDAAQGLWTVSGGDGKGTVKARVLVCADGATSRLATELGYCKEPPRGVCSRAFVEAGSHNTNFDGVCFYPKRTLPGYFAIFRHPNDELLFCCYLIPCGKPGYCGDVTESDLARLHNDAIKNDPYVSAALGPNPKMERMKAAALRVGGQGLAAIHGDHLLIVGDAAGHIDPLTGEGIHTAMMGGKAAALTLAHMRATGDFSAASTKGYARRCHAAFGHDFAMSTAFANIIYRYPIVLDALASEVQRRGDAFLAKYGEIMTCMRPKTYFLRPDVVLQLGWAVVREIVEQKVLGKPHKYKLDNA